MGFNKEEENVYLMDSWLVCYPDVCEEHLSAREVEARYVLPLHRNAYYIRVRAISPVQRYVRVALPGLRGETRGYTEFKCSMEGCGRWYLGHKHLALHQHIMKHSLQAQLEEREEETFSASAEPDPRQYSLL